MSKVLGLFVAVAVIIIKLYYGSNDDEKEFPLSNNYWMVHDPKYNPYNT